jgi:hypothetical protein
MTAKDKINSALFGVALIGAIVCFAMGQAAAGSALLAFAGGHAIRSPFASQDGADPE